GYKKFISTARALRSYDFDLALIFHGNEPQATPLCYLSGARFIFKLPNSSDWNFLLSNREPITKWNELRHGIEARLKTAALAGCKADGFKMDLFIENSDTGAASDFLKSVGVNSDDFLIGFQPGASTLSRQWFPDRFVSLGKRLIEKYPFVKILLTGSPDEKALCEAIAKRIGPSAVVSAGAVTLNQGAALIKKLKCFITGDTGPMHIAYAVGTPVVALYAVSDPQRTGPLLDAHKHRVIKKPRYCEPCASKKCEYQKCMEAISVDEVLGAVTGISALPDNSI
ncbi:glycosyltransferase family 9 protein, partial [bacterium]